MLRQKNSDYQSTSHHQSLALTVVGVMAIVVVADLIKLTPLIQAPTQALLTPIQIRANQSLQWTQQPWHLLAKNQAMIWRLQELEARYSEASAQLGELEALRAENEMLKNKISGNTNPNPQSTVIATTLVSLSFPAVAAGESEGVRLGQAVLVDQTLVGVIKAVSPHQAEISLLSQPDRDPILVQTESGAQGIVIGDGRRVMISEIPIDQQIQVGERVVTLGQTGIRRDIYVGRIQSVKQDLSAAVQSAIIEQDTSFYRARLVYIE